MDQDAVSDTPQMMIERLSTMVRDVWPSLHEQGIGPDRDTIVSVAAVGLVEKIWRNSPVEDAHASRRGPNDGEMMAQSLHLHAVARAELGVVSQTSSVLAFERYVLDFERPWHGTTRLVKDMLWGHLVAFRKHVKKQSNFLLWIEDEAGQDVLLGYLCMVTRMYGGRHYGMPVWPRLVEGAISHLSRPDDPCWHDRHEVALEAIRTHFTESWEQLEQALCEAPHDLDPALLQSLIDAGLFYVGERSLIRMCP